MKLLTTEESDNGRGFVNAIISELAALWPELKLVTKHPRHPQSQSAVERLNGVIQEKLTIWMKENNSRKWSVGLKWQVNINRHETTGHSPFKVTFGQHPQALNVTESDKVAGAEAEAEAEADAETEAEVEVQANTKAVVLTFQKIRASVDQEKSKTAARMTRRGKHLLRPQVIVLR
ncbi:hypothetical protein O3P69_004701 [Scylla paramamosain]|uniref:Integrase catalytic domain-containing protein n=1 Tax=Scylla paramamosain TaxID=85552 RepID=A0AAW0UCJ3_SCYPA